MSKSPPPFAPPAVPNRRRPHRSVATAAPVAGPVLHPGVLITDSSGDIVFWNQEARAALERLGNAGCLAELFDPGELEHLFGRREWLTLTPRGAADVWRVRARRWLDSGRSLVFFFADPANS